MKLFVLAISMFLMPHVSFADTIVCGRFTSWETTFKDVYSRKNPTIQLVTQFDEPGQVSVGKCTYDKDAIELALTCAVPTQTHGIYTVRLYSPGGSRLGASVENGDLFHRIDLRPCIHLDDRE